MPVVRFELRNEYALADPQLYGSADRDDPEALLEGVAMAGIVGVLRQLGDLAEFAAGIFHNLHEEVMTTSARGHSLMLRVEQLEAEFPVIEKAFLSQTRHLEAIHNAGVEWHPNSQIDQNLITRGDMPRFVLDSYEECRGPPRLFTLDKFDVAGAGACLKRYSDPSFFKTSLASSGAIEPEMERETRTRKPKKKILRLRNGENPDPSLDPHNTILNHMRSEKAPPNIPAKRVKLKMRPLNYREETERSYMEPVLERYMPDGGALYERVVECNSAGTSSIDPTAQVLSASNDKDVSPSDSLIPGKMLIESHVVQGVEGQCIDEENREETTQGMTANDKLLLPQSSSGCSDRTNENIEEQSVKEISSGLKEKAPSTDFEIRSDGGSEIYVSDDVASEVDNFMDALATIDSEIETDSENMPNPPFGPANIKAEVSISEIEKPKQLSRLSSVETEVLNSETREDKKMQSLQILDSDSIKNKISITVDGKENSGPATENSLSFSLDPCSFQNEEVHGQKNEIIEFSALSNEDSSHSLPDPQSSNEDEVQSKAHESTENFSAFVSSTQLTASSDMDKALISEQEIDVLETVVPETKSPMLYSDEFLELHCSLYGPVLASSSSPLACSTSSTSSEAQGSGVDIKTETLAPVCSKAIVASDLSRQFDFTTGEVSSSTNLVTPASNKSSEDAEGPVVIKHPGLDSVSLQDNVRFSSMAEESTLYAADNIDNPDDASHRQMLVSEGLISSIEHSDIPKEEIYEKTALKHSSLSKEMHIFNYSNGSLPGNDLNAFSVGEMQFCQLEKHESHGYVGHGMSTANAEKDDSADAIIGVETVSMVSYCEDSECLMSKSPVTSLENKIQTSILMEDGFFPEDSVSSKQPILVSAEDNLPAPEELLSDAFDNNEIVFSALSMDEPPQPSTCVTSESPSDASLSTREYAPTLDSISKSADLEDNIFNEQHHSPIVSSISHLLADQDILDAAAQKHKPETDEDLGPVMQDFKYEKSRETYPVSCHGTVDNEKILSSNSESMVLNKDATAEISDNTCLDSTSIDTDVTSELQSSGLDFDEEKLSRRQNKDCEQASDTMQHESTIACSPEHEKLNQAVVVSGGQPTDLDTTSFHECLKSLDSEPEISGSQTNVVKDVIPHLPDKFHVNASSSICLADQPNQTKHVDLSSEDTRILLLEHDGGISSESPSNQTIEDCPAVCALPSTVSTNQLHLGSVSSEPSCAKEISLDFDTPTGSTSHASCDLDPQPTPLMLQAFTADVGREILETEGAHLSETNVNISAGEDSLVVSSCKLFETTVRSVVQSDQSLSNATASRAEGYHEATILKQHEQELSSRPLKDSLQPSVAPVVSMDFPNADPLCTLETLGKESFDFPAIISNNHQSDLDGTPPLPPLPPLQWRMGKPKPPFLGSTATASNPLSGSNAFASVEEYSLVSSESRSGMRRMDAYRQIPATDDHDLHYGSMATEEGFPLSSNGDALFVEKAEGLRYNSVSVGSLKKNAEIRSLDAYNGKDDSCHYPITLLEETGSLPKTFAQMPTSFGFNSQNVPVIFDREQTQFLEKSLSKPTLGIDMHGNNSAVLQSVPMDLLPSNPFIDVPVVMDPRYRYGYRFLGGESLQPLATHEISSHHGFYMPFCENVYGSYSMMLPEMEAQKFNGKPLSILNRPRDPLIEAVASHDKSTLRKVSEIVQTSAKTKEDEKNTLLDQIKQQSFSLKPTLTTRPRVKGPTTNLKVAAILEKAKAMRQACAGSDDEDNWSDS